MPFVTENRDNTLARPIADVEVAVVGTGPAGLLAALTMARLGLDTALVGPAPNVNATGQNARTAALFPNSIDLLTQLGVWQQCEDSSEPLTGIRIVDDLADAILRAPEVLFRASEIGAPNFGFNVPNDVLVRSLWSALANLEKGHQSGRGFRFVETPAVKTVRLTTDCATLVCESCPDLTAKLIVAADGRNSICRKAAGLETQTWTYPQTAVTCLIGHSEPHAGISTELHRQAGPCTTVPMPSDDFGHRSSLVWMESGKTAERLLSLSDEDFQRELERHLRGHLGVITHATPRAAFPLSGLTAPIAAANRVALVGEAAHVVPPIGAQGLNLGFRDVMQLAELLNTDSHKVRDPGAPDLLANYARARKPDITARIWGIDLLNRSLLAGHGPVHLVRGAGLAALKAFPALRRQVIRQGLNPFGPAPNLSVFLSNPAKHDGLENSCS